MHCTCRTAHCGPCGVLIIEVSLYMTAHCSPSGVLIIEVSLSRTAHCGPCGVLIVGVSLYICSMHADMAAAACSLIILV